MIRRSKIGVPHSSSRNALSQDFEIDHRVRTLGKALTAEPDAIVQLFLSEMPFLVFRDRRKESRASIEHPHPIPAAFSMAAAARPDIQFDRLGMSENIQVGFTEIDSGDRTFFPTPPPMKGNRSHVYFAEGVASFDQRPSSCAEIFDGFFAS